MVSVLTDCPHREKLGWLEQYHLNGPAIRYEFDVTRIFGKGMRDMADSQTSLGLIPNIAPEYTVFDGTFRAAAEWGCAFIVVPWQQYLYTGDTSLMHEYYPAMEKYMDYLATRAEGHILDEGLGDWYDIVFDGERPGHPKLTPPPITATAFYYYDAHLLAKIAALLGKNDDAEKWANLAEEIRDAWLEEFRNDNGTYATNSQCSNAIALVMELAHPDDRETALTALVEDVRKRGNAMTAGDVGFRYLLQALAAGGESQVIYDMINQDEKPGYGYHLSREPRASRRPGTPITDLHTITSCSVTLLNGSIKIWWASAAILRNPVFPMSLLNRRRWVTCSGPKRATIRYGVESCVDGTTMVNSSNCVSSCRPILPRPFSCRRLSKAAMLKVACLRRTAKELNSCGVRTGVTCIKFSRANMNS